MLYYLLFSRNLTPQEAVLSFVFTVLSFIIALSFREFMRSFVAYKMGDPTPKLAGRLTLNPLKHIDTSGFLMFMLLGVGWSKPSQINPMNFKKYKTGMRWISIVGILTNFVLGLIAAGIFAILLGTVGIPNVYVGYIYNFLMYFMIVNSFLAMFNLLPLFPLDGFTFVTTFLKPNNKFVDFGVKNSMKILLIIFLVSILGDLIFGFDVLDWYLSVLYNYVYVPIGFLGVYI